MSFHKEETLKININYSLTRLTIKIVINAVKIRKRQFILHEITCAIYRQFVIEKKSSVFPSSILVGFKFDRQLQVSHHDLLHLKLIKGCIRMQNSTLLDKFENEAKQYFETQTPFLFIWRNATYITS